MDLNNEAILKQKQSLSPAVLESLRILSLSVIDLMNFLNEERNDNPLLELDDSPQYLTFRIDENDENPILDIPAPQENVIEELLLSQIDLRKYSDEEIDELKSLIGYVDSNGRLTMEPDSVALMLHISVPKAIHYIELLRSLEPKGIAAASLEECLILQLPAPYNEDIAFRIFIKEHLCDLANGKVQKIANSLGINVSQIQHYIEVIKTLNPYPLNGYDTDDVQYIIPDVSACFRNGCWEIKINDGWVRPLRVNAAYEKLISGSNDERLQGYLLEKIHRINYINEVIEKRREFLKKVATIICQIQEDFLLGKGALKQLSMTAVADELEVYTSTVSRCVKDKYLQTSRKVYKMSSLFSFGGVNTCDENKTGREEIKRQISMLLECTRDLSDNSISKILNERGISVSRRTVAKYRKELGINGRFLRKYLES